jgi:hypothetical protein
MAAAGDVSAAASAREARLLRRLHKCVDAGDMYGALQLYKTTASRKVNVGSFSKAAALYSDGAELLAGQGAFDAAAELGCLLLDVYESQRWPLTASRLDTLTTIIKAFSREGEEDSDSGAAQQLKVVRAALKWSREVSSTATGNIQVLHALAADAAERNGKHAEAVGHFIDAEKPER